MFNISRDCFTPEFVPSNVCFFIGSDGEQKEGEPASQDVVYKSGKQEGVCEVFDVAIIFGVCWISRRICLLELSAFGTINFRSFPVSSNFIFIMIFE